MTQLHFQAIGWQEGKPLVGPFDYCDSRTIEVFTQPCRLNFPNGIYTVQVDMRER